jgi:transposase InsO family protein
MEGDDLSPTHEFTLTAQAPSVKADLATWHWCLGHLNMDMILRMAQKGIISGIEITSGKSLTTPCEPCLKGKQTWVEIQKTTESRSDKVLGCIHSDLCGKILTRSHKGYYYFVTWIDDTSRKVFVDGLCEKSDTLDRFKVFVECAEVQTGKRLQLLHSDGGGEYKGGDFNKFLEERGIQHEITTPHTPEHNGIAEWMNHTLLDKVRVMLTDVSLPNTYWYDVLEYAALLHNISHTCALDNLMPDEVWSGNKPDISMCQVFSSRAFMHVPKKKHAKLAAWLLICTFIGLAKNRKAYQLVHWTTDCFFKSRDVVFNKGGPVQRFKRIVLEPDNTATTEIATPTATPQDPNKSLSSSDSDSSSESESEIEELLDEAPIAPTPPPDLPIALSCPKHNVCAPIWDDDNHYSTISYGSRKRNAEHAAVAQGDLANDPRTYAEAMACLDAVEWELACNDEKQMFENMGVYELVPYPTDRKIVGSKWVFRIKRGPDGKI